MVVADRASWTVACYRCKFQIKYPSRRGNWIRRVRRERAVNNSRYLERGAGYTTWDCSVETGKKLTQVNLSGPGGGGGGEATNHVYKFLEVVARQDSAWRAVERRHRVVFGNIERVQSYGPAVKLPRSKFPRDRSPRHPPLPPPSPPPIPRPDRAEGNRRNISERGERCTRLNENSRADRSP